MRNIAKRSKENQTDKDEQLVCLYTNDREAQFSYIEAAKAKGYNVLLLDGQLDAPLVSQLEQKWEKDSLCARGQRHSRTSHPQEGRNSERS